MPPLTQPYGQHRRPFIPMRTGGYHRNGMYSETGAISAQSVHGRQLAVSISIGFFCPIAREIPAYGIMLSL